MDIPQGYKQTELGIIPEDWEIVNLGSVAKINGRIGFRGYTTADLVGVGQGAYTIGGKHITNMVLDLHDAEYISWQKYYESPEIMVRKGDIVFAQRGTLGKSAFIVNDIGPATINPSLVLINKIKCDNEYLSYWLQCDKIVEYICSINSQTSIPMITQNQIEHIPVVLSRIKAEQQAIAEALGDIDGLIATLDKKIAKIMRKLARKVASDEPIPTSIKPEDLYEYLGAVEYSRDKYQGNDYAGVVTGLAWTAVGGEILFVESSLSKGKGSKLTLTGNLGDVMKESAMLALEYIHAHAAQFNINEELFENWNVHVHVPEGAIPKDGPSAGITMVTSLVSAFTQRKVKKNLAMTGEITLRGKVLPVGGIKEKILAAKRAGIKELILCKENEKDINEIKPEYLKGLVFHYVSDIQQVVDLALLREKVDNPLF